MSLEWFWMPLAVLAALALYQQFRIYSIRREAKKKEELFQIVTENAADMIALVDVKGPASVQQSSVQADPGVLGSRVGRDFGVRADTSGRSFQSAGGGAGGAPERRGTAAGISHQA
jgi:hypothetical protein